MFGLVLCSNLALVGWDVAVGDVAYKPLLDEGLGVGVKWAGKASSLLQEFVVSGLVGSWHAWSTVHEGLLSREVLCYLAFEGVECTSVIGVLATVVDGGEESFVLVVHVVMADVERGIPYEGVGD